MLNPHSTKVYETPTILFQTVLVQAVLGNMNMKDLKLIIFGKVFAQMTAKSGIAKQ